MPELTPEQEEKIQQQQNIRDTMTIETIKNFAKSMISLLAQSHMKVNEI